MLEKTLLVKNKLGLHARPAALLVQLVAKYKSKVSISKNEQEVDGRSIMGLMTLAAECGSTVTIVVEGEDEQGLLNEIEKLFENKFNED